MSNSIFYVLMILYFVGMFAMIYRFVNLMEELVMGKISFSFRGSRRNS